MKLAICLYLVQSYMVLNEVENTLWAGTDQSVKRLPTDWTVRESNPVGSETFRTRSDQPWGPSSLLYKVYRVFFQGIKPPGHGADNPPPSRAEVKERV